MNFGFAVEVHRQSMSEHVVRVGVLEIISYR